VTSRFADVTVAAVQAFHARTVGIEPASAAPFAAPFAAPADAAWMWIATNHRCNCLLWAEEDEARRPHVPDSAIAANKRAIDRYNQQRNDAVEQIDAALLTRLADVVPAADAWQQSETAGAMIDRMSILALKVFNMTREAHRAEAGEAHRAACAEKLARLVVQRDDLGRCFDALLERAEHGRVYWRVYRQFKMYNDPALNPALYRGG
jgi:hypothetical protein